MKLALQPRELKRSLCYNAGTSLGQAMNRKGSDLYHPDYASVAVRLA